MTNNTSFNKYKSLQSRQDKSFFIKNFIYELKKIVDTNKILIENETNLSNKILLENNLKNNIYIFLLFKSIYKKNTGLINDNFNNFKISSKSLLNLLKYDDNINNNYNNIENNINQIYDTSMYISRDYANVVL
jgi:hypothetical protein